MNRTGIEYGNYTWNPVSGCIPTWPCYDYCWARGMANRLRGRFGYDKEEPFKPTLHFDRLEEPLQVKKPSRILVTFMGDLFCGAWAWRGEVYEKVFDVIERAHWHTFIILTKRPTWMREVWKARGGFPKNCWIGVTVSENDDVWRIVRLLQIDHPHRFVSFEPLLEDLANGPVFDLAQLDWVILGAQTGKGANQPRLDWVKNILFDCDQLGVPVFMKDNLEWTGDRPLDYPTMEAD